MSDRSIRITGLDVYLVGTTWRNFVFVRLTTDSGIEGWGEATAEYREHAIAAHLEFLSHRLVGMDALAPGAVWERIVGEDFMRGDVVGLASAGGVMTACLDIAGKAHDVPLHQLLGGALRTHVPVYANGWYRGERAPATFAELARAVTERGYRALKIDPFGSSGALATRHEILEGATIVGAVREAVGVDVEIYIDAHGRFTPSSARFAADALAVHEVGYLEEPVAPDNLKALQALRDVAPIPIAAGERCLGRQGFKGLIEGACVDVIQPDICWCGGPMEARYISAWAELHQMVVSFHNANSPFATAVGCHVAAAIPNLLVMESFDDFDDPWISDAFPERFAVADGLMQVPKSAGVGITPDPEAFRAHPAQPIFLDLNQPGWEMRQGVLE